MSNYEEDSSAIERVQLTKDYWAEVQMLSKRDDDACRAAQLGSRKSRGKFVSEDGVQRTEVEAEYDDAAYLDEMLVRGITAWNLTGKDGAVWPIDYEHVARLRGPHANRLIKAIRDLSADLPEEKKLTLVSG